MSLLSGLRMWAARNLSEQQKRQIKNLVSLSFLPEHNKTVTAFKKSHPVQTFDAFGNIDNDLETLRQKLLCADVEWAQLPADKIINPILVIADRDTETVLDTLRSLAADGSWTIRVEIKRGFEVNITNERIKPAQVQRLICSTNHFAANGRELSTAREQIIIEPWETLKEELPRVDGSTHIPGTLHRKIKFRNTLLEYLTPVAWQLAQQDKIKRVTSDHPHIYEITEPIDLVYTWVDGDDPQWRSRQQQELAKITGTEINDTATNQSRFLSRDELKYSLRSVQYYANWVNHIYIVTDAQVPEWLNTAHPKITVIDHKDIFKNTENLPVFNSHAIESQLHHIPGLSERYLYMNDDIMFMRPVEPALFYTANGLSKFFPSNASLDVDQPSARDLPVLSAAKRNRKFIETKYGRTITNKFKHTPHPQLKSVLEKFEKEQPELFASVAASKFRHPEDYSIPSALYHFVAYCEGKAINSRAIRYGYLDIASENAQENLNSFAKHRSLDVLCVNDTATDAEQVQRVNKMLGEFLAERFPVKSAFEK